jgi:DNA-binding response OmpR family regulator
MPMKNGFELAHEMMTFKPDIPFLFLTAQAEKESRIKGFEFGAEDYILKPFSMQELGLRIKAILRRVTRGQSVGSAMEPVPIRSFLFYPHTRELKKENDVIRLSEIESNLLRMFLNAKDGIIFRDDVLKQLWNEEHLTGLSSDELMNICQCAA